MIFVKRSTRPKNFPNISKYELRRPLSPADRHRIHFEVIKIAIPALMKMFHQKCCYCETPLIDRPAVDQFKPKSLYPELAYKWNNLYISCNYCNTNKGARFPTGIVDDEEVPLLIDPCRIEPAKHLTFFSDGRVAGITLHGKTTIDVLRLNRDDLVNRRERVMREVRMLVKNRELTSARRLCSIDRPYSAAANAALKSMEASTLTSKIYRNRLSKAVEDQKIFEQERAKNDARLLLTSSRKLSGAVYYVQRVELRNIGGIQSLDLDVPFPESDGVSDSAPWLMLLGDNGFGKSTILKAIAFALAGDTVRNEIGSLATCLLPERGIGTIKIFLSSTDEPVVVVIDPKRQTLLRSHEGPQTAFLGYGPSRLLPTSDHKALKEKKFTRLRNLFDPFVPLADASDWLNTLSNVQFERVAAALHVLLDFPENVQLRREQTVRLHGFGAPCELDNLSDGFRSAIALACDIMSVLLVGDQNPEAAEAVVLIDELGNHLHPTWRIKIVTALRQTFPRVQFIASTHDPLCLRGLQDGEIVVLRRDEMHRLHALSKLPSARGMLVDQLLSSSYFGLFSTLDPATDARFARYYELLAKQVRTNKEQLELNVLRTDVNSIKMLGNSPREEALLAVIDQHLSENLHKQVAVDPKSLPKSVQTRLKRILEKR